MEQLTTGETVQGSKKKSFCFFLCNLSVFHQSGANSWIFKNNGLCVAAQREKKSKNKVCSEYSESVF